MYIAKRNFFPSDEVYEILNKAGKTRAKVKNTKILKGQTVPDEIAKEFPQFVEPTESGADNVKPKKSKSK